ncbi:hypothetical protein B7494_g3316 [Chlorociboria aeruginascens]|nr:hypothetical protein B7494_g3316 [Chlorociboria aeruginascens]
MATQAVPLPHDGPVQLQVGERRFTTTLKTLVYDSAFFSALFSGRWDNTLYDGAYFIDADGDIFAYILCFLRRPALPPIFDYDRRYNQPSIALYRAILEEARYFQIHKLELWLEAAIDNTKIITSVDVYEGTNPFASILHPNEDSTYQATWVTKKVYVCPRGIYIHRGNYNACGAQCMRARGSAGNVFEDEKVLNVALIRKRLVFDVPEDYEEGDRSSYARPEGRMLS